jgi:hypothetical protein
VALPRPLAPDADVPQLTQWLTEWNFLYGFDHDEPLRAVLRPTPLSFDVQRLRPVMDWKLGPRKSGPTMKAIEEHERANPGDVQRVTASALSAPNDATAIRRISKLAALNVAVGSAVLMAGDPERWTVADRRSNDTLVALRTTLRQGQLEGDAPLHGLAVALDAYDPPVTAGARTPVAKDWPAYVGICRQLALLTSPSLRSVDRAIYTAAGR